jgi:hypothetical protein
MGGSRSLSSTAVGAKPFVEEALRWLPDSAAGSDEIFSVHDELLPVPCPPVSQPPSVLASLSPTTTPTCASIWPVYCRNSTKWKLLLTVKRLLRRA